MKIQRGRILRDTSMGLGMVISEGNKHEFDLAKNWSGDIPPKIDMVVEIILSNEGVLELIKPVDVALLGKEKAEKLAGEAQVIAKKKLGQAQELLALLNKELGLTTILLIAVISLIWIFAPFVDVSFLSGGDKSVSMSAFASLLNADEDGFLKKSSLRDSGGVWTALIWIGLLVVPLAQWFKPSLLKIAHAVPFAVVCTFYLTFYFRLRGFASDAGEDMARNLGISSDLAVDEVMEKAMDSFSLEFGFYLAILLTLGLLIKGLFSSSQRD